MRPGCQGESSEVRPVQVVQNVQSLRSVQNGQIADATARFNSSTVHGPVTTRQSPSTLKESAVKNWEKLLVTGSGPDFYDSTIRETVEK
jgi:hypothetical protein